MNGELKPFIDGQEIVWAAQPGSQTAFLDCPVFEVLLEGSRGGGKTDSLLMDFAQHTGKGFGVDWRGVLFRQTFPQLADVIAKSKKFFPRIFPRCKYNESQSKWTWPDGEELMLRHMMTPSDYWCVPYGDVCTPDGWKKIQDVKKGEMVLSSTPEGKAVWAKVKSRFSKKFDGDLVHYEGQGLRMTFTENHRLPVMQPDGTHVLMKYSDAPEEFHIRRSSTNWEGTAHPDPVTVPFVPPAQTGGPPDKCKRELSADDLIEFLGWFLSEGCLGRSYGGSCRNHTCAIGQSRRVNPDKYAQIARLLTRIGIHFSMKERSLNWTSKSWRYWLDHFGKSWEKYIPFEIRNLPIPQLKLFFDTFVLGDGNRRGNKVQIGTVSPQMRDDLTEIGIKLGYRVCCWNRTPRGALSKRLLYFLTFSPEAARRSVVKKNKAVRVPHKGPVYCLEVEETGCFFLRQHDTVWLSGNSFHGFSLPWIAFEELTSWPNLECYLMMMSCSRSTRPDMPRKYRSTTNPYGVGHNVVKQRFHLPIPPRRVIGPVIEEVDDHGEKLPPRVAIHSLLSENKVLLMSDPQYRSKIRAAAPNPAALEAWLYGSWDITSGGMFDDVWQRSFHVVPNIVSDMIPRGWRIDRSYDHGQSRPFSVGWWAQSNGEPIQVGRHRLGTIRGDTYRIAEWYGSSGSANEGLRYTAVEIAQGIMERESRMRLNGRVRPGPADTSIYDDYEPGRSVAGDMARCGVHWLRADKSSGSRKQGWQQVRQYLKDAIAPPGSVRERPGLFICECCTQFLRTVPVLPRDEKDPDDVDTDAEDHVGDEVRYRLRVKKSEAKSAAWA